MAEAGQGDHFDQNILFQTFLFSNMRVKKKWQIKFVFPHNHEHHLIVVFLIYFYEWCWSSINRSVNEMTRKGNLRPSDATELQKRWLFATKLFRWLQKAIRKTSVFDGKSLSSTITRQILKHLWRLNKSVENTYYFCWKFDFFWREVFPPYFLWWIKNVRC